MPTPPVLFSSATDNWATPQGFFDEINVEFGFQLDVCASTQNAKCRNWFGPDHPDPDRRDGLTQPWTGGPIWCNAPYGTAIGAWMAKAAEAAATGETVVCLIPARTDTRWFHDHLLAHNAELRFLRGRLSFGDGRGRATFPSILAILRPPGS